jgi:uncharacterized protein
MTQELKGFWVIFFIKRNSINMSNSFIGIGLRSQHLRQFVSEKPDIGWVEVHSENFYTLGGPDFDCLLEVRKNYPISLHGIGMSLGSHDGVDEQHLSQVKKLIDIIDPFLVSDHLSWNTTSDNFLPDLLPTPFNTKALDVFARNISAIQDKLGRELLLENPSTYFEFNDSTMSEPEFLNKLTKKTGAKIILDVNNIYISGLNNGWSSEQYIEDVDISVVKEIHLSGHFIKELPNNKKLYIDAHDSHVCEEVWQLYQLAINKFGSVPTLVEWDVDIPALSILVEEAKMAEKYLKNSKKRQYA